MHHRSSVDSVPRGRHARCVQEAAEQQAYEGKLREEGRFVDATAAAIMRHFLAARPKSLCHGQAPLSDDVRTTLLLVDAPFFAMLITVPAHTCYAASDLQHKHQDSKTGKGSRLAHIFAERLTVATHAGHDGCGAAGVARASKRRQCA